MRVDAFGLRGHPGYPLDSRGDSPTGFACQSLRLQLRALVCNLATVLRCIGLPEAMAGRSLTSLQLGLIRIGVRVVHHARAITIQLAEVAVTGPMVPAILAAIRRFRALPSSP